MGGAGSWIAFKEIVARLAEHRVSAIPVVDACHRVLGVVSEADLLLKEEFPEPEENLPLWWTKQARLDRAKAAGRRRLHTGDRPLGKVAVRPYREPAAAMMLEVPG